MAEVFRGTPSIVKVEITDDEQHLVTLHVAGQGMRSVEEAVQSALEALGPNENGAEARLAKAAGAVKTRKPRRTKAQMLADEAIPGEVEPQPSPASGKGEVWPQD